MASFFQLVRKDLEASRWPVGILSALIVGYMLLIRFRFSPIGLSETESLAVALSLPLIFLPLWMIWQSFQALRTEWREDTVYTLLTLPIPGWQVISSKLVGLWVEYSLLLGVSLVGALVIYGDAVQSGLRVLPSLAWAVRNGFLLYLFSLAVLSAMVVFVQLAYVIGKMVGRLQGLVAIWTLFLSGWLVDRLGLLLEPLFRWMPPLPLHKLFRLDELKQGIVAEWNVAPALGTWLGILALFILTGYLFEHYVEVND